MNTNRRIWKEKQYTQHYNCWHRSTSYKGGKDGRPAVEQLVANRRRSLSSDDSRTGVQRTDNSSIDDTTPPTIAVVSDFTSRRSPHSDHFTNVVVQLLRCRISRPPRVPTDVTQRRRGTITFKLFDAPLHESSAANFTIFASVGRR